MRCLFVLAFVLMTQLVIVCTGGLAKARVEAPLPPVEAEGPNIPSDNDTVGNEEIAATVEKATSLVEGGEVKSAISVLTDLHARSRGSAYSRIVHASLLAYSGDVQGAIAVLNAGLSGTVEDVDMLSHLANLHRQLAEDGPAKSRSYGAVVIKPDAMLSEEEMVVFRREHLSEARKALEQAFQYAPDPELQGQIGLLSMDLEEFDRALEIWRQMLQADEENPLILIKLAETLGILGRAEEAISYAEKALKSKPRSALVNGVMAELQKEKGSSELSMMYEKKASFYSSLPEFLDIEFSEEDFEIAEIITTGEPASAKLLVDKLEVDDGELALQWLTLLCFTHLYHGDLEERALQILEDKHAAEWLKLLFTQGESTCTVRSSGSALSRLKPEGAFELLAEKLPAERSANFSMGIAGHLAAIGDVRAVPHLVRALDVRTSKYASSGNMSTDISIRISRQDAALALGYFDTPESRSTLEACLSDPEMRLYCRAALYRITRNETHLDRLGTHLESEQNRELVGYLLRMDDEKANKIAKKYQSD